MDSYLNAIDYTIILLYLAVLILLDFRLRQRATAGLEPYAPGEPDTLGFDTGGYTGRIHGDSHFGRIRDKNIFFHPHLTR